MAAGAEGTGAETGDDSLDEVTGDGEVVDVFAGVTTCRWARGAALAETGAIKR